MLRAPRKTNSGCGPQRSAVLIALLSLLLAARSASAQDSSIEQHFAAVPFQKWAAEGPKGDLPWHVHVTPPKLTLHQRIAVKIEIQLDGKELVKRCCDGQATALIELTDPQGHPYRNFVEKELKDAQLAMSDSMMILSWQVFLLPGDYRAVTAFFYSGHDPHSLTAQKIHVEPLRHDPLPEAWRNLPTVEFTDPQPEGLDELLLPSVAGRLQLPAKTAGPVRIEIIANLTPYPSERRKPKLYTERLGVFLPILKTLAQLDLENGSLRESVLDLTRRSVIFNQQDIKGGNVAWAGLKEALSINSAVSVNVDDLREEEHLGDFLREEMTRRLADAADDQIKRIFILVSGPMDLGPPLLEIVPPADARFVLFYLKCNFLQSSAFVRREHFSVEPVEPSEQALERAAPDGIARLLKGLQPRTFPVDSAQSVRQALAAVLGEISRM
jgi:hypothetical protein